MRRLPLSWCSLVLAITIVRPAAATPEIRTKFGDLAQRILDVTENQPVTVGIFSHTGLPDTNAGPGLEGILAEALNQLSPGIVQPDTKYEVKGDYAFARSREPRLEGLKVIKIRVRVIDVEFAEDLVAIPLQVILDHTRTVAEVLQVTGDLPPAGSKQERNEKLIQHQQKPAVHIVDGTRVCGGPGSPYSVEILVRPLQNYERHVAHPRPVTVAQGMAFVDIHQDELYEVQIYNDSGRETAVSLSIDGLDMFHFSEDRRKDGRPKFTHMIIPAKSAATIVGWHKSVAGTENYLSFLVTAYGQGAVSQAGIKARGQVGVIHAQFSQCYPLPEGAKARGGNETGFGPPRTITQKPVRYEIEPPHEFVTVRYTRPQG